MNSSITARSKSTIHTRTIKNLILFQRKRIHWLLEPYWPLWASWNIASKVSVFGVIQSEFGKMQTRITPYTDTFYVVKMAKNKGMPKVYINLNCFTKFHRCSPIRILNGMNSRTKVSLTIYTKLLQFTKVGIELSRTNMQNIDRLILSVSFGIQWKFYFL